ncbi:VWA domain-containing protein [Phyllobacterium sp. 0TCS1.6C]|uniref:VWA domain-containing protein n=1 Tax=unclassified Phyllobacterium TaxID=2638441 RepID=UPI0022650C9C|nr:MULTISPECIES: VWA domain-containing protein [unclassified Phyllobacterium]MCX8279911.1 VWA domain-containing protein [Phyllobacterium sp. 0TCS1.6C]MCX8295485.1 VWA domain-containing protein [Phyllobacterium sp. 0TCS1.6A]
MNLSEFVFLRPWWLIVPPLLVALGFILRDRGHGGDWVRATDPPLLRALEKRGAFKGRGKGGPRLSIWLIVAGIIATALGGPAVRNPASSSFRNLDGVIVALDTSKSMIDSGAVTDGQIAATHLIDNSAASQQVGLILFAGDAYLGSPFSADRQMLYPLLGGDLSNVVAEQGSAPARAMTLAQTMFSDADMIGGDLVLVTDGGGVDPAAIEAARALRKAGRRANVLFVASAQGDANMPAPDRAGAVRLAAEGGGILADTADLSPLLSALDLPLGQKLEKNGYTALAWLDLGRYMLILAAIPFLGLFGRRI